MTQTDQRIRLIIGDLHKQTHLYMYSVLVKLSEKIPFLVSNVSMQHEN